MAGFETKIRTIILYQTTTFPMQQIVFATNNPNKIKEVNALLGDQYNFLSLQEIGCTQELEETQDTLEGNAIQKASYVQQHFDCNCFSEDTGLEIHALNGAPGVITARYAGPERNNEANMAKVLEELKQHQDRSAQFRTVIALFLDGEQHLFEGIVKGRIALEKQGDQGFGYDPIFIPEGHDISFAQMDRSTKNTMSHRARAIQKLTTFLKSAK